MKILSIALFRIFFQMGGPIRRTERRHHPSSAHLRLKSRAVISRSASNTHKLRCHLINGVHHRVGAASSFRHRADRQRHSNNLAIKAA